MCVTSVRGDRESSSAVWVGFIKPTHQSNKKRRSAPVNAWCGMVRCFINFPLSPCHVICPRDKTTHAGINIIRTLSALLELRRFCWRRYFTSTGQCIFRFKPTQWLFAFTLKTGASGFSCCIDRVKWRHSNPWSPYDLHVVGHDVVLCEVNWWRFVTLFKLNWIGWFKKGLVIAPDWWSDYKCCKMFTFHFPASWLPEQLA